MTDDREPDDQPELTESDDAFVRSLLARAPAPPMPADVVARVQAALTAQPDLADLADLDSDDLAVPADPSLVRAVAANVVPIAERRRTPPSRILQVAAAAVLVVGGGALAIKTLGHSATDAATAGSGAAAPVLASDGSTLPPLVTSSGAEYTQGSIDAAVRSLATKAAARSENQGGSTTDAVPTFALAQDSAVLARCIAAVQGNPVQPQPAVSVDLGTFEGKPAVVVVVQSTSPNTLSTYVTTPACGTTAEPTILFFANVPRS